MFPFDQTQLSEDSFIRTFSSNVDPEKLVWHRDKHPRLVEVVKGSNWQIQLENQIPAHLNPGSTFSINAGQYHRLIKGTSDLVLVVKEVKKKGHKSQKHNQPDIVETKLRKYIRKFLLAKK